jgi:RHS repeat-associated protein
VDTSYLYKAFGEQTILTGSNPNRFTWLGKLGYYRQPDTDDYWVRARIYKPSIGRWVSRDPLRIRSTSLRLASLWSPGTGMPVPPYEYVQNKPVGCTDPQGLLPRAHMESPTYRCTETMNKSGATGCCDYMFDVSGDKDCYKDCMADICTHKGKSITRVEIFDSYLECVTSKALEGGLRGWWRRRFG